MTRRESSRKSGRGGGSPARRDGAARRALGSLQNGPPYAAVAAPLSVAAVSPSRPAPGPHPAWRCLTSHEAGDPTLVAVKIRLKRMGKIRAPYYRIVVADSRTKRDGRVSRRSASTTRRRTPVHRGQLRAGAVLARRRRPAHRAGPGDPEAHRRLAEVQGRAGGRGHPQGLLASGPTRRPSSRPRPRSRWATPRPRARPHRRAARRRSPPRRSQTRARSPTRRQARRWRQARRRRQADAGAKPRPRLR